MINKLDSILLNKNACSLFNKEYESNDEFKSWILTIIPEIKDAYKMKQDNPWHIYDCLDHILHSVEAMNKQNDNLNDKDKRMLAYTMFLHDIGKPQCHLRRFSKLYGREIDSFFNHNKASAEIALRVLPKLSFNDEDIKVMHELILDHDIFINLVLEPSTNPHHVLLTKEYLQNLIQKYNQVGNGLTLVNYLIRVGRSDNLAQNPEMTKSSLILVDKMEEMRRALIK